MQFRIGILGAVAFAGLAVVGTAHAQAARDFISIVGSSTVFPFSAAVAENFGKANRQFRTPKVEATGTGGGIKLFCNGVGISHPDVANASRRMNLREFQTCQQNGVRDILEVKVGYDGIVLAGSNRAPTYNLSRREVYLALAKNVPSAADPTVMVPNPYTTWRQINSQLPDVRIEVLGPPPTSGTRDAFVELVMEAGCRSFPWLNALRETSERRFKQTCGAIREDGVYVEAGENDNLIVQKLQQNPRAIGIFGFSFLEENLNSIHGSLIEGVKPEFENILKGRYPVSRSLYFYVKKAHVGVIPGITEFVNEFVSERAVGEEGYLVDKGLIPLPTAELNAVRADVKSQKNLRL
ncbi:MAG: substrate-binding domain-containing protein [Steroidobacteraceae bacterium]|jgi:phosphate transport system substrate-binding protein|nr:substrate-binding domain-containing protein [Steroidobacteraceae bacterium]